jgi:hypothetical protein
MSTVDDPVLAHGWRSSPSRVPEWAARYGRPLPDGAAEEFVRGAVLAVATR